MSNHNTHLLPSLRIPYLHGPVTDPLTMCLPSGEYATERTESECPVSVHFGFKVTSPYVSTCKCSRFGRYDRTTSTPAKERISNSLRIIRQVTTQGHTLKIKCTLSVHSCSWTKHGGQHSARSSKR